MSIVVVFAATAVAIWAALVLRWGGRTAACLMALLAGCLLGEPFFHLRVGPAPLTIDRLALVGVIGMFAVGRFRGDLQPPRWTAADWLLTALLVVVTASALLGGGAASRPVALAVFFFLLPSAFYWLARQETLTAPKATAVLVTLTLFGLYLAVTGIAEWRGWNALVFPRYIVSLEYEEFLGRARGPLLNPIGNGLLLSLAIVSALLLGRSAGWRGRLAVAAVLMLLAAGVYATLTRSVWLGAGAAIAAALLIHLPLPRLGGALLCGALLLGGLLLVGGKSLQQFKRDKNVSAYSMAQSAKLRPLLAAIAWRMFQDRPLFGCGFGRYKQASLEYLNAREIDLPTDKARGYVQHNVLLALLTETGIVGAGLYLALLTAWGAEAWWLVRGGTRPAWAQQFGILLLALLAAVLINGMFHDVSIIPMVNAVLFYVAGLTTAARSAALAAPDPAMDNAGRRTADREDVQYVY